MSDGIDSLSLAKRFVLNDNDQKELALAIQHAITDWMRRNHDPGYTEPGITGSDPVFWSGQY